MCVEIILTLSVLLGMIMYYFEDLRELCNGLKRKINLKSLGFDSVNVRSNFKKTPVNQIEKLLKGTLGIETRAASYVFIAISIIISEAVMLILKGRIEVKLLVVICIFSSLLPLLLLLCRLKVLRIEASKEGEILLTELLDNYKINYYNMQQAIEVTALTIKEAPGSKRLLFNLSKGLNTAGNSAEIRLNLDEFEYGLGTSWASVAADNMYFALVSGIKVTAAMEDLVKTLSQARKVAEYSKRENNESLMILKYLVPGCFALTVLGATKYFGLSVEEYLRYQFLTTAGMNWFIISMLVYAAGLFLAFFLSKTKLDL